MTFDVEEVLNLRTLNGAVSKLIFTATARGS